VTLDNIGGMPAPVDIEAKFADGSSEIVHETSAIWENAPKRAVVAIPTGKSLQSIVLQGGVWVDADSTNNRWMQR
jgi:hypothetical protein